MTALSLTPSQNEELRKRLGVARDETAEAVRSRIDIADEPSPVSHLAHRGQPDDIAQASDIGDNQIALAGYEEARLAEIDQALARLDEGIANMCIVCGNEIGFERLLAVPTAQTCLECQKRVEHQDRIERPDHPEPGPTM